MLEHWIRRVDFEKEVRRTTVTLFETITGDATSSSVGARFRRLTCGSAKQGFQNVNKREYHDFSGIEIVEVPVSNP